MIDLRCAPLWPALCLLTPALGLAQRRVIENEATYPVEVTIDVAVRLEPFQYRPVPEIAVELGVGLRSDARSGFADRPVLARAVSDEVGQVRTSVEVPAAWFGQEQARIWARVAEPGHQQRVVSLKVQPAGEPPRLLVVGGGTIYGRVVDEAGQALAGARVAFLCESPEGPVQHGGADTDAEGRFSLGWSRSHADERLQVIAWKNGLGAGSTGPIGPTLAPWPLTLAAPIRLEPAHAISGQVLDPRGAPVAGLTVTAVPTAGFPERPHAAFGSNTGGPGVILDRSVTDLDGRYTLRGMARGDYRLHGRILSTGSPLTERIREDLLGPSLGVRSIPSAEAEPLLFDEPYLEVTVAAADGTLMELADSVKRSSLHTEPRASGLVVSKRSSGDRVGVRSLVSDRVIYPVEPDTDYSVSWTDPGLVHVESFIHTGWQRGRIPVQLNARKASAPARVTFRATGPVGQEPETNPQLTVFSEPGGRELFTTLERGWPAFNRYPDEGWKIELPPGRYRVTTRDRPYSGCVIPTPFPRTDLVPTETVFEVLAGEDLDLELPLGPGGHLDFEPLEPLTLSDFDLDRRDRDHARERLNGVEVVLISPDGSRRLLKSFDVGPGLASLGDGSPWIAPRLPARSLTPTPPGDYLLRLERPNGPDRQSVELLLERPITIRAGEITTVRW